MFVVDDENVIASTLGLILRNQGLDAHSFHDHPRANADPAILLVVVDRVQHGSAKIVLFQ